MNAIPSSPCETTSVARTSTSSPRPISSVRADVRARMRRTRGSSPFRIATPSGGSEAGSSPLICSVASIEPKRSRCVGPTFVTMPMSGAPTSTSSSISQRSYGPISTTAHSCDGASPSSASGRPMSLLKLRGLSSVS